MKDESIKIDIGFDGKDLGTICVNIFLDYETMFKNINDQIDELIIRNPFAYDAKDIMIEYIKEHLDSNINHFKFKSIIDRLNNEVNEVNIEFKIGV